MRLWVNALAGNSKAGTLLFLTDHNDGKTVIPKRQTGSVPLGTKFQHPYSVANGTGSLDSVLKRLEHRSIGGGLGLKVLRVLVPKRTLADCLTSSV